MDLRVTGPPALLTAKIDALHGRDKPKDAYDIVWLIESWPGGPAAAASPSHSAPPSSAPRSLLVLRPSARHSPQPTASAPAAMRRFLATDARDEPQLERRASGAIAEFAAALSNRS